ncbi:LLM class flavin-dependent oxidoreductase [Paenibacillus radicis (ex Xue et al. 2023)]|uniref:LLM class flavin-dependent oxidoreductase n=1 Tax=Paenibacillus radicis (ex Xue et al. 2023) TaxID=2972489 RepID=A0ABT1YHY3_9BACL|nr:LLM class flavin-dependent oxidoreductase [Paenibacillus radicis (ex Xue et al. 2023)]MCR8632783.1 LLM class flavin-dependent oxidoreductase [Paenibacillus radicis (ex Xue et al. 2023)]
MSNSTRKIKLGLFIQAAGHHVGGWRHPDAQAGGENLSLLQHIAQTAERGKFDLLFIGDGLGTSPNAAPSVVARFEPLTLLGFLSAVTKHIGLAATSSTTYGEPFHMARAFASLDHLSGGRAAWNVVTTSSAETALNFSKDSHPDHSSRYEKAKEFVEVVKGLWDSWEDGAFIHDKESGVFFDKTKLHYLDHKGPNYSVRGPLNVSRPPQGYPVLIQAGSSNTGQDVGAEIADIIFTAQQSLKDAQSFYAGIKSKLAQHGKSPEHFFIMPGLMPIIGKTEQEARDKFDQLSSWVDLSVGLDALSARLGQDVSKFPLDELLPELPETDGAKSRSHLLTALARREQLTVRQLAYRVAGSRGHGVILGTPSQIADHMEEWFAGNAADGFNIMPPYFPGGLEDFVELVVPELQRRGLFRTEYEGRTLRENLGLPRPKSRYARV